MQEHYQHMLNRLLGISIHSGIKLGLHNILKLVHALSLSTLPYKTIHIAGTNGKGSVSSKCAAGLQSAGFRTGLFTSPHIGTFRERIAINGELISHDETAKYLEDIFSIIDREKIPATFFEITTTLALMHFKTKCVDYAVIETGLGGRFDATNIIVPILSVVTSISLDHTEILGNSLEAIAFEKAGIVKENVPCLIGAKVPKNVFKIVCKEKNASLYSLEGSYEDYISENNAIAAKALALIDIPSAAILQGLSFQPSCRYENVNVPYKNKTIPVIFDVAHNPDGFEQLIKILLKNKSNPQCHVVLGISSNKDFKTCLQRIFTLAKTIHFTQSTNGRTLSAKALYEEAMSLAGSYSIRCFHDENIAIAVQKSLELAYEDNLPLVICGSFFIMADAKIALGLHQDRDFCDMNERNMYAN